MLLKIFVKRKPHGELNTREFEFSDSFAEADRINKTDLLMKQGKEIVEFTLSNVNGDAWTTKCETKTHGFEILNNKGVSVYKYVTPIYENLENSEEELNDPKKELNAR